MRDLSNTTGSYCDSKTPGNAGDFATSFTGKAFHEELIDKANSVPITKIFKHYGVRLDERNIKTTCPFLSHKGGRERTPSFYYYPSTNTYCCFGCKQGSTCCDFVAIKEKTTKVNAAYKILELFGEDIADGLDIPVREDYSERLNIMMDFSNSVREFRQTNVDQNAFSFIEEVCSVYDNINVKHELDNVALRKVVDVLKNRISSYIGQ